MRKNNVKFDEITPEAMPFIKTNQMLANNRLPLYQIKVFNVSQS